jgi:hypothetical protein
MDKITSLLSAALLILSYASVALAQSNILSEKVVFRDGKPVACPEKKVVVQIELEKELYYQCFLPSELADRQSWPQTSIDYNEVVTDLVDLVSECGGQSNAVQVYR